MAVPRALCQHTCLTPCVCLLLPVSSPGRQTGRVEQLTQQLPAIAAAREVLGAEPKDDWDVDESLLRGYDADDTAWYDSWAESDTEEEEDEITDDSGAAEAPWWTSESSGADAYIELEEDEVEGDEEEDSSEEDSEADDSV